MPLSTLALAWALTDPGVTSLIVGPRSPGQLTSMCEALDLCLSEVDRTEIAGIADGHRDGPDAPVR
jgi:aryl-alcohol dehydrogenase-like predicted oxidoreductase